VNPTMKTNPTMPHNPSVAAKQSETTMVAAMRREHGICPTADAGWGNPIRYYYVRDTRQSDTGIEGDIYRVVHCKQKDEHSRPLEQPREEYCGSCHIQADGTVVQWWSSTRDQRRQASLQAKKRRREVMQMQRKSERKMVLTAEGATPMFTSLMPTVELPPGLELPKGGSPLTP
jgi:hypothetical protein